MEKYIRTKNNIYDMSTKNEKGEYDIQIVDYVDEETYGGRTGRLYLIPPKSVIKQADTIEELCDEFVLVDENYCHNFYIDHYYDDMVEVYEEEKERCKNPFPYPRKPRIFYGAIWTDKGLIYVAKMNEKGELELL